MAEFWTSYLWPLIIMVAQSVMLLVILLVAIAYVLLADRKIWAENGLDIALSCIEKVQRSLVRSSELFREEGRTADANRCIKSRQRHTHIGRMRCDALIARPQYRV